MSTPPATDKTKFSAKMDWAGLLILTLPPLFWAGNFVVGRAVRNDISPMTLSFGRWLIALVCILPFAWRPMWRDLAQYWQNRWRVLGVSLAGVAAFNSLVYTGLHTTTVTNGILLNSTIPILIVLFGVMFYAQRISRIQVIGLIFSFAGVLTIILHGEWQRLMSLTFTRGDLIVFSAMVCWALYTLWLRGLPAEINRIGLMGMQIVLALIALFPFYLWEQTVTVDFEWTSNAALALAYVGIFPSVVAYLLYNMGVVRVGPVRAGLFIHLMPVFGTILSVAFLGEALHLYHVMGATSIFLGIVCAGYPVRKTAGR